MSKSSRSDSSGTLPKDTEALARTAKLRLLRMHYESGVGHIGGNLSALDALLYLHHQVMGRDDVFILSKGHAAGALYVTLWTTGELSDGDLLQFHGEGTKMSGHPAPGWSPGISMATGSLGHGFPIEDFGNLAISPGVIDTHVHINEPGRSEWEGFETRADCRVHPGRQDSRFVEESDRAGSIMVLASKETESVRFRRHKK